MHSSYLAQQPRQRVDPAAVEAVAPAPLKPIAPEAIYIAPLEVAAATPEETELARQATPYVLGVILLLAIALFLRTSFAITDRRNAAPVITVVIAALVLLGAYAMGRTNSVPAPIPVEGSGQ
ncbi:MAG: hypothetical protein QM744_00750 [Mesorhizobium sp.]